MIVLAIDPGPKETAWAFLSEEGAIWQPSAEVLGDYRLPPRFGKVENRIFMTDALDFAAWTVKDRRFLPELRLVLEKVEHYGKDMHAGETTFETVFWSGRFIQHYLHIAGEDAPWHRMGRREVKHILAGSAKAKDGDIRVIVRDRLGPKGTKSAPGPTWGVTADVWQALGLGLAYLDDLKAKESEGMTSSGVL